MTEICSDHNPVQHRDGKPPWCKICGLTENFKKPVSKFLKSVDIPPSNDWLQTFSGKAFYPLEPRIEDIDIYDIGHSLAMQCRYNGHVSSFYSVAEHSVHVSRVVPSEDALWALLHDSTETYVGDMIRPLKKNIELFSEIEYRIMRKIVDKFNLQSYSMPDSVREADNRIIENERIALLKDPPLPWTFVGEPYPEINIQAWDPLVAEYQFFNRFFELTGIRTKES